MKLKYVFPFIQCQCFDKRRGVYLVKKVSVFIKIRVLFWPEISAVGVFFNIDNERMRPPKYPLINPFILYHFVSGWKRHSNTKLYATGELLRL